MIVEHKYKNREEWLELRRGYIGGSDAAAIVGMNPYKSAYALWAEKTGKVPEFTGNVTTKVGSFLEQLVAEMFSDETGKKVRRKNAMLENTLYPWAEANVDRMVCGEPALLECKTTNSFPAMRQIRGGEFPDMWYCQMLHYLAVTGLKRAYLAVIVGGREFHWFTLERDEDEIAALMDAERDFWTMVKDNVPPPIDGAQSSSETVSALYPENNEDEIDAAAVENDMRQYMELGARIKELKAMQDGYANQIKSYLKDAAVGRSEHFKVTWKAQERRTFDANLFQKKYPDADISDCYKTSSARVFKLSAI